MIFTPPSRALRSTTAALAIGFSTVFLSAPLSAQDSMGSVSIELVSPTEVSSFPADLPFEELYIYSVETVPNPEATTLWKLHRVQTRGQTLTLDGEMPVGDEEEDELVTTTRYFGYYESFGSSDEPTEVGLLAWKYATTEYAEVLAATNNVVGFVRSNIRPSEFTGTPVDAAFSGASGDVSWTQKWAARSLELTLSGAPYAPADELVDRSVTLSSSSTPLSLNSFEFEIPESDPLALWRFSSSSPVQMTDSTFVGIVGRSDVLEAEDLPSTNGYDDLNDFWQRTYFLVLRDTNDADRDGIPDFLDLSESVTIFPWYADYDGGDGWYYSIMIQEWVYSTRLTEWDYHRPWGWTWVPKSSTTEAFWCWIDAGDLKWVYTARGLYPYCYRDSDGVWLYHIIEDEPTPGQVRFWNFSEGKIETISF